MPEAHPHPFPLPQERGRHPSRGTDLTGDRGGSGAGEAPGTFYANSPYSLGLNAKPQSGEGEFAQSSTIIASAKHSSQGTDLTGVRGGSRVREVPGTFQWEQPLHLGIQRKDAKTPSRKVGKLDSPSLQPSLHRRSICDRELI